MSKKAKANSTGVVVIVIALIVLAVYLVNQGVIDLGSISGDKDKDTGGSGITATTPQVTFNCRDLHNPQTSVSCNILYKINGGGVTTDADGAGIEVSVGDTVEWMANASNYYREHGSFVMPAKNIHTVPVSLLNYDTSPTIKIFDEDDGLLNSATNSEALPANAEDAQEVKVTSSYKDGIKGMTLVVDYVRTNIDDVTSDIGADIQEPDSLTHNTTAGRGSADTFASFLIGDLNVDTSKNSETKTVMVTIDVGSTSYGTTNMTFGLIDKDWYQDANGGFSYGYEEPEENTDVGQAHHAFDTLFYTAST